MNSRLVFRNRLTASAAAAAALLALACGSDPETGMMPPAQMPAPAPTQVVQLGALGGSITLASTGSGGWTLNGQPFSSNTQVSGDNGLSYLLTLAGGTWTAEFVAPPPFALALGMSGEEVALHLQEDSSYLLDGTPVTAGRLVVDSNGDQYVLGQGPDGTWQASFVVRSESVQLGEFGGFASLASRPDGTWTYRGVPFANGQIIIGSNGFDYLLRLGPDGQWAAQALARNFRVPVSGPNQAPLELTGFEDGRYYFNDLRVFDGTVITRKNGNVYELSYDGSSWTARFVSGEFQVPIEDGYFLTFRQDEAGRVRFEDPGIEDPRDIMDGDVVQSTETEASYAITASGDVWAAARVGRSDSAEMPSDPDPDPPTDPVDPPDPVDPGMTDPVDPVDPMLPTTNPNPPDISAAPTAQADRLILFDAVGAAVTSAGQIDVAALGTAPTGDDTATENFLQEQIDLAPYSGKGRFQRMSFVDEVVAWLNLVLAPIEDGTLTEDGELDAHYSRYFDAVNAAFATIFGPNEVSWARGINVGVDRTTLEGWRTIFSTRDPTDPSDSTDPSFKNVLSQKITNAMNADADATGDAIYAATRFMAMASTENTVFGVQSSKGATAVAVAGGDADLVRTPFAYSGLHTAVRSDLSTRGAANYLGSAWAVDTEDVAYSGRADVRVQLSTSRIDVRITEIQDTDGGDWSWGPRVVGSLDLPPVFKSDYVSSPSGGSFATRKTFVDITDAIFSTVNYAEAGVAPTEVGHAWVEGRIVGRPTQSGDSDTYDSAGTRPGAAIIGVFTMGDGTQGALRGSFGAEYVTIDEDAALSSAPLLPGITQPDGTTEPGEVNDRYIVGGAAANIIKDSDTTITSGTPPSVRVGALFDEEQSFGTSAGFAAAHIDNYLEDRTDTRTNRDISVRGRPLNNIRFTSTDYSHMVVWSLEFHDPDDLAVGLLTATPLPAGKNPGDLITSDFYLANDGTTPLFDNATGYAAYSWLTDSAFETRDDAKFPDRLVATYTGKALMVDNAANNVTLYEGDYEAVVTWGGREAGASSTIAATLNNFTGYTLNGRDLGDITFSHGFDPIGDGGCGACFSVAAGAAGAQMEYANNDSIPVTTGEHRGQFAGDSIDGPLTLFGGWSVTGTGFSLEGSYGANLWGHDPHGGATVP